MKKIAIAFVLNTLDAVGSFGSSDRKQGLLPVLDCSRDLKMVKQKTFTLANGFESICCENE